ncbi:MAG: HEPN domain-containing protein [Oligoflexia bacterium]|nr:HEPN domain-containing protein [Oligoflexia bacterium]
MSENEEKISKLILYWKMESENDYQAALDVWKKAQRNTHSLFFLHLSIEKILKAYLVFLHQKHAPYSHNLLYLAEQAKIALSEDQKKFLLEVNEFNLECRYPDQQNSLKEKATATFMNLYLQKSEDFRSWILEKLK